MLELHTKQLEEQGKQLELHGKLLESQGRDIKGLKKDVKNLDLKIEIVNKNAENNKNEIIDTMGISFNSLRVKNNLMS